ncbi:hypothetical protein RI367_006268 [Sorochytrium milnesiophthora]
MNADIAQAMLQAIYCSKDPNELAMFVRPDVTMRNPLVSLTGVQKIRLMLDPLLTFTSIRPVLQSFVTSETMTVVRYTLELEAPLRLLRLPLIRSFVPSAAIPLVSFWHHAPPQRLPSGEVAPSVITLIEDVWSLEALFRWIPGVSWLTTGWKADIIRNMLGNAFISAVAIVENALHPRLAIDQQPYAAQGASAATTSSWFPAPAAAQPAPYSQPAYGVGAGAPFKTVEEVRTTTTANTAPASMYDKRVLVDEKRMM